MMDLIERQATIDEVDSETVSTNPEHFKSSEKFIKFMNDADIASFGKWQWANGFNTALVAIKVLLKKLPSAQPETPCYLGSPCEYQNPDAKMPPAEPERKKGKWIEKEDPYGFFNSIPVCSECGCTTKMRERYNFCPNCGADMRGEQE